MTSSPILAGPWPEPEVIEIDDLPLVVVRREKVRIADLGEIFDTSFGPVRQATEAAGLTVAGPAVAVYEGDPMTEFSVEVGHPVDGPLPAAVEVDGVSVVPSALAAGRFAVLTYLGPYDGLGEAWGRLMGWVHTQQLSPGARYGEIYVTEPTPDADPSRLRSDLYLTLE
ncbi:MAG TPA: GyrI-like domain-containing protein [Arachnia sp.]|nr:GyrI-like domain-containing protein [Arachnia sp.]HMT85329.1 GyrI-like domain-containing protein [Arachnia sp.]